MAIEEIKNEIPQTEVPAEPKQPEIDYKAEYERLMRDNDKLKRAQSNASADVSRLKKELESRMSEEELAKTKRDEELAALRSENAQYKERERISTYKARLMESGYDSTAADKLAKFLPEGVTDEFFESQKAFLEETKSKYRAEALNAQPKPSVGTIPTAQTAAESEQAKLRKLFGLN